MVMIMVLGDRGINMQVLESLARLREGFEAVSRRTLCIAIFPRTTAQMASLDCCSLL